MNIFICYDRCSTCKKAEKWLEEKGVTFEKRPLLVTEDTVLVGFKEDEWTKGCK